MSHYSDSEERRIRAYAFEKALEWAESDTQTKVMIEFASVVEAYIRAGAEKALERLEEKSSYSKYVAAAAGNTETVGF